MTQSEVAKYRQVAENVLKYKHLSEEDTMIKVVIPFFEMLGWDARSNDMRFEHRVYDKKRHKTDHVDIALFTHKGKPDLLVEVKNIAIDNLSRGSQLFRYLKNSGVRRGLYTNGREMKLITRRGASDKGPNIVLHFKNLADIVNYSDALLVFSKKGFQKGMLDRFFEMYHKEFWEQYRKRTLKAYQKKYKITYPKKDRYKIALEFAEEKSKIL